MRRSVVCLASLACLMLVGSVQAQQSKTLAVRPSTGVLAGQTAYTNSYAILIGVGDYAFLPKDKHLDFAATDATDLRDLLIRSYGFPAENITILLDSQATRANIEAALSALSDDKVKAGDRVLVYFSGHGQTVKLQDGGEMGFLIPFDAKVDLAHPENRSGYLASCLRMDSIWGYLEASAAKHRLLIADSCFGGLLIRGKALNAEKPNRAVISSLLERPALQAMTAGASNEEAEEDPRLGHSAYTFKLLEELKAQAATPDNVFLASELAAALKTSVGNLTNSKQTPQFGNYRATEGDFVFISTGPQRVPLLLNAGRPSTDKPIKTSASGGAANLRALVPDLIQQAQEIAAGLTNPNGKAHALNRIALAQVQGGDIVGAHETAAGITTSEDKDAALLSIAEAQLKAGDIAGAKQTAAETSAPANADQIRDGVALALAHAGDVAGAKQAADGITNILVRTMTLGHIGLAQAQGGDPIGAQQTFLSATQTMERVSVSPDSRITVLSSLALAQAEGGDKSGATQTVATAKQLAESILDPSEKADALATIASAQVKSGDLTGAKQILSTAKQLADRVPDAEDRILLLNKIAPAQIQAGDRTGAIQTFRGAIQAAEGMTGASSKIEFLIYIAQAQAQAGEVAGGVQTLSTIRRMAEGTTDANFKAYALTSIAQVQAQSGDRVGAQQTFNAAKQTAEGIADPDVKARDLTKIAQNQAQAGDIVGAGRTFDDAKQTAARITDGSAKAASLADIAQAIGKATGKK